MNYNFLIFILILIVSTKANIDYERIFENERVEDLFRSLESREVFDNYEKTVGLVDEDCFRDINILVQAEKTKESWALRMLDSSSKVPSGILGGNMVDVGAFDQCLAIDIETSNYVMKGQHCIYFIGLKSNEIPFPPMRSICLPSTCTSNDVVDLIKVNFGRLNRSDLEVSARCTNTDTTFFDTEMLVFLGIMGSYIGFLILCTLCYQQYKKSLNKKSEAVQILSRFSFLENSNYILNTQTQEGDIQVIHGLRAISTLWLLVVHETFFHLFYPLTNFIELTTWFSKTWTILIPLIGLYSVDTFLALSGFLTAYNCLKQMKKNDFSISRYYLHRFIRLTPSVAVVIYGGIVLSSKLGTGPRFDWMRDIFISTCRTKWWSFLLYISNFVEEDSHCMVHLWSITVDVQFMIIAPVILYLLYRKRKIGLTFLTSLVLTSALIYGYILGTNGYNVIYFSLQPNIPFIVEAFQNIYVKPYTRASPWLLGLLFGCIVIYETSAPKKIFQYIGWLNAIGAFTFCVIGTKSFTSESYVYDPTWEVIFGILSKPLWAFGICWIIYASIHNFAGPISTILSMKVFLPLSKISFSMCLVHLLFPLIKTGTTRTSVYFSDYVIWHSYLGNLLLSIVASFIFSITFELPMRNLEKLIPRKKNKVCVDKSKKL